MTSPDVDGLIEDLTPRYELGEALGRGAFGAVHRARERTTGREVALKLLQAERAGAALDRFLREAAVAAALDDPGIIRVHAAGRFGGRPCIVYELVDGEPFRHAVRRLDAAGRARLVRDAARAVGVAHARGIVHRDLKPDNLLVDREGRVRVADFGLVHVDGADRLTRTGAMVGTPTHMAPEQFATGPTACGPPADVWALGVVLYEALTGRLPFEGPNLVVLAARIEEQALVRPRAIDPTISPALEAVVLRALERDPTRRPADGLALAAAIDEALSGAGQRPRRRIAALAVVGVALALLGAMVAARWGGRGEPEPPGALAAAAPDRTPQARPTQPPAAPAAPSPVPANEPQARRVRVERTLLRGANDVAQVAWVDDRRLLVVQRGRASVWDVTSGDEERAPLPARVAARVGSRVLLGHDDGGLLLLEAADLRAPTPRPLLRLERAPRRLAGAERRSRALALVEDKPLKQMLLLDLESTPARAVPASAWTRVTAMAISPDGEDLALLVDEEEAAVATTGRLGVAFLMSAAGLVPEIRHTLSLSGYGKACAFSVDGRALVVGTSTGQLLVLDRDTGQSRELASQDGMLPLAHTGRVTAVATTGRLVLSVGERERGAELKVWDLASGREVATPTPLPGSAEEVRVSPDGQLAAIVTQQDGVHVRPVPAP